MYVQLKKFKKTEKPRGVENTLTHVGLYKDDGEFIKRIAQDDKMLDRITMAKIDITIPELEGYLKEHEIIKLMPRSPLFDNIPLLGN